MRTADQGSTFHILTAAELNWQNGHEFGIQAIRYLLEQGVNVQYRLVGRGDFLEAIACARHDLGLDSVIQLLMEDYHQKMSQHLEWADTFLLAAVARTDRHGLLDAIRHKKPVVTTDVFGRELQNAAGLRVVPRREPL
ncbi:MAG TPA: glycosyltransferase, partial [Anaerolineales bacterium]|nr:glycosyltransferase [Anaerolineales bacterium]